MKRILYLLLIAAQALSVRSVFCVTYGSTTAVSVEGPVSFPSADNDNTMLGFGWFKNGFTLEDSATTCTFSSVYPVSGTINSYGNLYLQDDLIFNNISNLSNFANVVGNNYAIELCSSITHLPLNTGTFSDLNLYLNNDLLITGTITFLGNCTIHGNGYFITVDDPAEIAIGNNSVLTLENLSINHLSEGQLHCVDDTGRIILDNINWIQDANFTFSVGSIFFRNHVNFSGASSFAYSSGQTSTIDSASMWSLSGGIQLSIGRKELINYVEPLNFVDESSIIKFDGASFLVTATGMQTTKGTVVFDSECQLDILGTATEFGWILGTGNIGDDFMFHNNSGSLLHFNQGWYVCNNTDPNYMTASSKTAHIKRYGASSAFINQDWVFPSMTLEVAQGNPTTVLAPGKSCLPAAIVL